MSKVYKLTKSVEEALKELDSQGGCSLEELSVLLALSRNPGGLSEEDFIEESEKAFEFLKTFTQVH